MVPLILQVLTSKLKEIGILRWIKLRRLRSRAVQRQAPTSSATRFPSRLQHGCVGTLPRLRSIKPSTLAHTPNCSNVYWTSSNIFEP
ncbi:hypothetical protein Leryth_000185 [Lithospermum erythrorhizon]|nr:hypothetical protein Leryth_000185 [Lithospermum erythrorhizon]